MRTLRVLFPTQAPSGLVGHVMLVSALRGVHGEEPIIFTHNVDRDLNAMSMTIRQLLSKCRSIANGGDDFRRVRCKALGRTLVRTQQKQK